MMHNIIRRRARQRPRSTTCTTSTSTTPAILISSSLVGLSSSLSLFSWTTTTMNNNRNNNIPIHQGIYNISRYQYYHNTTSSTWNIDQKQQQQQQQRQQQERIYNKDTNTNTKTNDNMSSSQKSTSQTTKTTTQTQIQTTLTTIEIEKLILSSFRSIIRPFLLKCHPDTISIDITNPINTKIYKQLNLIATQNLNSYLDTISSIILNKKSNTITNTNTTIELDFVVSVINNSYQPMTKKEKKLLLNDTINENTNRNTNNNNNNSTDSTSNNYTLWSRRKVTLQIPTMYKNGNNTTTPTPINWDDLQLVRYNLFQLRSIVKNDLYNLLKIASIPLNNSNSNSSTTNQTILQDIQTTEKLLDIVERDEINKLRTLNILPGQSSMSTQQQNRYVNNQNMNSQNISSKIPLTQYEKNRQKFWTVLNKNSNKLNRLYNETMIKYEATQATHKIISNDPYRKSMFIAKLLSYSQINNNPPPTTSNVDSSTPPPESTQAESKSKSKSKPSESTSISTTGTSSSSTTMNITDNDVDYVDDGYDDDDFSDTEQQLSYIPITQIEKFIALRRLALLFEDELFDELLVEPYGRYWETGTIYFTLMPIPIFDSDNNNNESNNSRKRKQSYNNTGIIFVHDPITYTISIQIPINFREHLLKFTLSNCIMDIYSIVSEPTNVDNNNDDDEDQNEKDYKEFQRMLSLPKFF